MALGEGEREWAALDGPVGLVPMESCVDAGTSRTGRDELVTREADVAVLGELQRPGAAGPDEGVGTVAGRGCARVERARRSTPNGGLR